MAQDAMPGDAPGQIARVRTHVTGLDEVTLGGLPANRTTLVSGTAGSGKTMLAVQFVTMGLVRGEGGVIVTFEETPDDIARNVASLGWDLAGHVARGELAFVDVSPLAQEEIVSGPYDLGGLLARIEHAVTKVGAQRVAIDSLGAVFAHYDDPAMVRSELRRLATGLRDMGVTAVLTAERHAEYGDISRFGMEEFVADNVVVLRNVLEDERRRRTLEVLKFRGTGHRKGEYPFTINTDGLMVVPLTSIALGQPSSMVRVTSGSLELDRMCGGGFFRDSIVLASGATGTGKTLLGMHFAHGGVEAGERVLYLAFEESRAQLLRNAIGWGFDLEAAERDGRLRIVPVYPEQQGLVDHLLAIRAQIDDFAPDRVAVDSLSALERVGSTRAFREFVLGLTSDIKHREIVGLFTNTATSLIGSASVTEAHLSTVTDSIILLRYVELQGVMRRALTVLKMRGSSHDKQIREFTIDNDGLHVGRAFHDVGGIISGTPMRVPAADPDGLSGLFAQEPDD